MAQQQIDFNADQLPSAALHSLSHHTKRGNGMTAIASQIAPTLSSDQAAELLYCSKATVEKLATSGKLPGMKVGSSWVFVGPDLIDWLRQQTAARQEEIENPEPKTRRRGGRLPLPSLDVN